MPATNTRSQWDSGNLLFSNLAAAPAPEYTVRLRKTAAEWNAGFTILAAVPGIAYRMIRASMIAYGGNAATATTVDITGTQTTSVKLVANAVAGLTRSAVLKDGATNSTVLADGASYAACDANTPILGSVTTNNLATATGIDVSFTFAMERT